MPRSRTAILLSALFAGALAACHDTTAPRQRLAPGAKPEAGITPLGGGYAATPLPLDPAGINDSGVIVGTLGSNAMRYYNGVLTPLPRLSTRPGDYQGQAINRQGAIAGNIEFGRGLFWRAPNQVPYLIVPTDPADSANPVVPSAINNSDVVVGSFIHFQRGAAVSPTHAFRWSPRGSLAEDITPDGYDFAVATDVNDAGYVVGYGWRPGGKVRALRWAPDAGNHVEELTDSATTATAIMDNGTAIGTADGFATTRYWTLNGVTGPLQGPQYSSPDDIAITRRLVGSTYKFSPVNPHLPWTVFNGVTTWLPVPNAGNTYEVANLHVNACGSIIGRQLLNSGLIGGVLWTKFNCDLQAPAPW